MKHSPETGKQDGLIIEFADTHSERSKAYSTHLLFGLDPGEIYESELVSTDDHLVSNAPTFRCDSGTASGT